MCKSSIIQKDVEIKIYSDKNKLKILLLTVFHEHILKEILWGNKNKKSVGRTDTEGMMGRDTDKHICKFKQKLVV